MVSVLVPRREQSLFIRPLEEKPLPVLRTINRRHDNPTRLRNALQLLEPAKLIVLIKMREHRDYVNQIESVSLVTNWRRLFAQTKRRILQILLAPANRIRIDVDSLDLRVRRHVANVNHRATTTTPEIKYAIKRIKLASNLPQRRLNIARTRLPNRDKLLRVRRAANTVTQLRRRQ